jgi:tRNA threonylcarbamoyladenosine biosynthesis protein TsaE
MILDLPDLAATAQFARRIAGALRAGDVVALTGGLGAGKTTLAREIIAALDYTGEVPSPSFAIIEVYDPPAIAMRVVHADFYRLEDPDEVTELGLDDYREDGVLLAEWPEHAGGFAHEAGCLSIRLEILENGRAAIVERGTDWLERAGWT